MLSSNLRLQTCWIFNFCIIHQVVAWDLILGRTFGNINLHYYLWKTLEPSRHLNIAQIIWGYIRFEVFTALTMKNAVFWDVGPCRTCVNRRFGGTYRLHLHGRTIRGCSHLLALVPRSRHIPKDGILQYEVVLCLIKHHAMKMYEEIKV
jgi:hypothetical protein